MWSTPAAPAHLLGLLNLVKELEDVHDALRHLRLGRRCRCAAEPLVGGEERVGEGGGGETKGSGVYGRVKRWL